jgi:hypothetical protein
MSILAQTQAQPLYLVRANTLRLVIKQVQLALAQMQSPLALLRAQLVLVQGLSRLVSNQAKPV